MPQRYTGTGWIGLNDTGDTTLIPQNTFQESQDVRVNDDYSVCKRTGFSHKLASNESETILDIDQIEIAQNKYEMFVTKSNIKRMNGTASTSLLSGLKGYDEAFLTQWNDVLLMSNGVDNVKKTSLVNNNYIFITDETNDCVYKFDSEMNYITKYGSNGTGNYNFDAPLGICTDDEYIYVCDSGNDKVKKYTLDFEYVASFTASAPFGLPTSITCQGGFLYVITDTTGGATETIIKIPSSTMSAASNLAIAGATATAITSNSSYLFTSDSTTVYRRSLVNMTSDDDYTYGNAEYLVCDSVNVIALKSSATAERKITISTMAYAGDSLFGDENSVYNISNYINILTGGTSVGYRKKGNATQTFTATTKEFTPPITNANLGSIAVSQNNFTEWHDLMSPYKSRMGALSATGSISATVKYKNTWALYNTDTETYTVESSGGLASDSATPASDAVDVLFDMFGTNSVMKAKFDDIQATHYIVYRSDDGADYRLQKRYPMIYELAADISDTSSQLTVTDAQTLPAQRTLYGGVFFYIRIDSEVIAVSAIDTGAGTTWTISRGYFGTTATRHNSTAIIVTYGVYDDVVDVSANALVPTENGYIDNMKFSAIHKGGMWWANSNAFPSRIWWTEARVDNDEDWIKETNYEDVAKNDGQEITGIYPYNDNLLVFKNNSTYIIAGDQNGFAEYPLSLQVGCVSYRTIVEYKGGLLFLGQDGLYYLYGIKIINLSRGWISTKFNTVNWQYAYKAKAEYFPKYNEYWLSIPTGSATDNNKIIVFNTLLSNLYSEFKGQKMTPTNKSFYEFSQDISALRLVRDSSNNQVLYSGTTGGYIDLQDDGNDDASGNIVGYFITKDYTFGFGYHNKFRRIITDYLDDGTWALEVDYSVDGGAYTSNDITTTNTDIRDIHRLGINASGKKMKVRYRTTLKDEPFTIYNTFVDYKKHRIR